MDREAFCDICDNYKCVLHAWCRQLCNMRHSTN